MAKYTVTSFLRVFEDVGRIFADLETDLFILLDEEGSVEWVNPAWTRSTGYTEADALHVSFIRFVDVDDYAKFLRGFTAQYPEPYRILRKGGGVVRVMMLTCKFRRRNPLLDSETEPERERIQRQAYIILRPVHE